MMDTQEPQIFANHNSNFSVGSNLKLYFASYLVLKYLFGRGGVNDQFIVHKHDTINSGEVLRIKDNVAQ